MTMIVLFSYLTLDMFQEEKAGFWDSPGEPPKHEKTSLSENGIKQRKVGKGG